MNITQFMSQIVNDVTLKCVTNKTITPPIYRIILFKGVLTYELDICLTSDFDINTLIGLTFEQAATIIDTQNKAYCSNKSAIVNYRVQPLVTLVALTTVLTIKENKYMARKNQVNSRRLKNRLLIDLT